jgi:hypothetical protein
MARLLADEREAAYVSTGHLPGPETVQSLVAEAQRRRRGCGHSDRASHHGRSRADRDHPGRAASQLSAGRDSQR